MKQWVVTEKAPSVFVKKFSNLPVVVCQLLWNRGLTTTDQIDAFFKNDWRTGIHDPFLFQHMQKSVDRVRDAITQNERITIHGDYDADGVSGAVILYETIKALGGSVDCYLPHRETEGYGMNENTVTYLEQQGTKLIITCDCGISNTEPVALARDKGIDVIITDHHTIPLHLPPAFAILHPLIEGETYPFKYLAGGGVAFKFVQAILRADWARERIKNTAAFEKWLLDLVAISSVADMVPILGENRVLVKYGLMVMQKTRRIGLQKLLAHVKSRGPFTPETISFQIAPRINAAGRLDHANAALALLIENNPATAEKLAFDLDQTNRDRQKMTEIIVREVLEQVEQQKNEPLLAARKEDWPLGIAGLVAGRIMNQFSKPVLIMTQHMGRLAGSGRSIPAFNLIKTLQELDSYLYKYGGHPQAAGFSLAREEDYDAFIAALREKAHATIKPDDLIPELAIDVEIALSDINWDTWNYIEQFEPFGVGNLKPKYVIRGVTIAEAQFVGQDGKHLRLEVNNKGTSQKVIAFGFGNELKLTKGARVDLAVEISVNHWNGNRELQLELLDFRTV